MQEPTPLRTPDFWIAVAVALIVKIKTSQQLGPWKVLTTLIVGVGAAYVGTDWAAQVTGAPELVAAAMVALTAEGAMRWILIALNDPKTAIDLWKHWRK